MAEFGSARSPFTLAPRQVIGAYFALIVSSALTQSLEEFGRQENDSQQGYENIEFEHTYLGPNVRIYKQMVLDGSKQVRLVCPQWGTQDSDHTSDTIWLRNHVPLSASLDSAKQQSPGRDSWFINKYGELVLEEITSHSAGRYTCLLGGRQNELILDVITDRDEPLRVTRASENLRVLPRPSSHQPRPRLRAQPRLAQFVESEIVSVEDLETIPGLMYSKQQLFCPAAGLALWQRPCIEQFGTIAWYKDGRELGFHPDGRGVDNNINVKLINFTDQFKLSLPDSCAPTNLILEIDGPRKDNTGRYTCALKFNKANLAAAGLSERLEAEAREDKSSSCGIACSPGKGDKSKCCDPQTEAMDARAQQIMVKQEKNLRSWSSASDGGDSGVEQHSMEIERQARYLEPTSSGSTSDQESLNYIAQSISRPPELVMLQTFAVRVIERPANSCSLWSTINEANAAYARRKRADFERLRTRAIARPGRGSAHCTGFGPPSEFGGQASLNNLPTNGWRPSEDDRVGAVGPGGLQLKPGPAQSDDDVNRGAAKGDGQREASVENGKLATSLSWFDGPTTGGERAMARLGHASLADEVAQVTTQQDSSLTNREDQARLNVNGNGELADEPIVRRSNPLGARSADLAGEAIRAREVQSTRRARRESDDLIGNSSGRVPERFQTPREAHIESNVDIFAEEADSLASRPPSGPSTVTDHSTRIEARAAESYSVGAPATNYEVRGKQTKSRLAYADEVARGLGPVDARSSLIKDAAPTPPTNAFNYANERNPRRIPSSTHRTMVSNLGTHNRPAFETPYKSNGAPVIEIPADNREDPHDVANDDGMIDDNEPMQNAKFILSPPGLELGLDSIEPSSLGAHEQERDQSLSGHIGARNRQRAKRSVGDETEDNYSELTEVARAKSNTRVIGLGSHWRSAGLAFHWDANDLSPGQVAKVQDDRALGQTVTTLGDPGELESQPRGRLSGHKLQPSSARHLAQTVRSDKLLSENGGRAPDGRRHTRRPRVVRDEATLASVVQQQASVRGPSPPSTDQQPVSLGGDTVTSTGDNLVPSDHVGWAASSVTFLNDNDTDEEDLLWAASQYLYMHMRVFASSSLYGVQVDVEWSNERKRAHRVPRRDGFELSSSIYLEGSGSPGNDEFFSSPSHVRQTAPFATIDLVSGQDLHLECTAQALGRLPDVSWFKKISNLPEEIPIELGHKMKRIVGQDTYWPVTYLDMLGTDNSKFVCSQSLTIFDNLLNQTFTVINRLKLSQSHTGSNTLFGIDSSAQDARLPENEMDHSIFACLVDADIRHDQATIGVRFRRASGKLPPGLSRRLRARSLSTDRSSPFLDSFVGSIRGSQVRSAIYDSESMENKPAGFDLMRQSQILVPLRSAWVPLGKNLTYLDGDDTLALDSYTKPYGLMSPIMLTLVIVFLSSSLVALVYLTLKSYRALTSFRPDDEDASSGHQALGLPPEQGAGTQPSDLSALTNSLCEFNAKNNSVQHRMVFENHVGQVSYGRENLPAVPRHEGHTSGLVKSNLESGTLYDAHFHGTESHYMCGDLPAIMDCCSTMTDRSIILDLTGQ